MKTIAYYISDYGYGHASRSIAIIRGLLERKSNIHVVICTSFAIPFLNQSLPSKRVSIRNINTDVGYYVNEQTIRPDIKKINKEYDLFIENWTEKVKEEENFLTENEIDFVISDISPLPFEAASNLKIPSVGISNFTWYTAYENIVDTAKLDVFKRAYDKMNHFFLLAGNKERSWNGNKKYYSFYARKVDDEEVVKIKNAVNPNQDKKIIFFGLGMKINNVDVQSLPIWSSENCVFIVSSNVSIKRENVFSIPVDDTESQHYIAASDLVISKAGWGTISEAVVNEVPLLILNRKELKEDQNTIQYIKEHHLGDIIEWDEFKEYQVSFDKQSQSKPTIFVNEVDRIVEDLLALG
ncbi:glycosyltransferase family protein [Niallia sp. 01092]|uniref:glycosyltransferase family protein n=1 Tax=unclassified Niallia TaxID=2837522 RepID=UPI003FD11FBE